MSLATKYDERRQSPSGRDKTLEDPAGKRGEHVLPEMWS